jgi:hypothetical protein
MRETGGTVPYGGRRGQDPSYSYPSVDAYSDIGNISRSLAGVGWPRTQPTRLVLHRLAPLAHMPGTPSQRRVAIAEFLACWPRSVRKSTSRRSS